MSNMEIKLKAITKRYSNSREVLKGLSLDIPCNSFVSIIGQSGVGKSTLLNVMGLLDTWNDGEYFFQDKLLNRLGSTARAKFRNEHIGFIFQEYGLLPGYDVEENIKLPALYSSSTSLFEIKKRMDELIEYFSLGSLRHQDVNLLSGGEKQRVAIARSLINRPTVVIADEPTGYLDSTNSQTVLQYLLDYNKTGKTIIMVTHNHDLAKCSDTVYKLEKGTVISYA